MRPEAYRRDPALQFCAREVHCCFAFLQGNTVLFAFFHLRVCAFLHLLPRERFAVAAFPQRMLPHVVSFVPCH